MIVFALARAGPVRFLWMRTGAITRLTLDAGAVRRLSCAHHKAREVFVTDSTPASEKVGYGVAAPGYRLPSATVVGRVQLQVADLERSLDWYTQALGMRVLEHVDSLAVLGPAGAGQLVVLTERKGAQPVARHGQLGLYHYALLLPDRASLGRFVAHVAQIGLPVGASDHLVSEALYLRDPDGLGIEVYADREPSSWTRSETGELAMATAPLDLDAVRHAAGESTWSGMPAGTVVGHVHLHVGDLGRAERFYHTALGFDKVVWSYPGALFLSAGGYHHHLGLNTWASGAASPGKNDAQLLEWEVIVPAQTDVRAVAESFRASGFQPEEATEMAVVVRDPWGTSLRVRVVGGGGKREQI